MLEKIRICVKIGDFSIALAMITELQDNIEVSIDQALKSNL